MSPTSSFIVLETLFSIFALVIGDFSLLLLHTNDMHSRFQQTDRYSGICRQDMPSECYGGFARLYSEAVKQKEKAAATGRRTLFLDAGDCYQGTTFYTFFKWSIVSKCVNMLGIDVMSLGNHELDNGISGLAPYIRKSTVPIVCCNVNFTLEPTLQQSNLTPSKVITVNGTRIGIIGYLTPETKILSYVGKLEFYDEISSIRAEARKLIAQNVNILIALGHSGYVKDLEIAKEVEDIDLVVGGHSHTFLYTGPPPDSEKPIGPYPTVVTQASGKQVPVVQAYFATKYLGYLELDFDDIGNLKSWNGSPILLGGDLPQDPTILEAVGTYKKELDEKTNKVLGYTDVVLDSSNKKCKIGECNIGSLIADAYVDYVARHMKGHQGWTVASVGLSQAGDIRASIDTQTKTYGNGSITLGDVITVLPWGGKIVVLNMTGEVLLSALEFSVARYEQTITGHVSEFLQVSGLQVVYNMAQPRGQRVESVMVRCGDCEVPMYNRLDPYEIYGVVMAEYIAGGGDGFSMFANITPVPTDNIDYMVLAQYIELHTPIDINIEGRIVIKGFPVDLSLLIPLLVSLCSTDYSLYCNLNLLLMFL